jgi:hypothetical protein
MPMPTPDEADSTRVPVIVAPGDTIAVAVANLIRDAGGELAFSAGEPGPAPMTRSLRPATGIVIAVGPDVARWQRERHPEVSVVEVDSVVQAFAALAVHDPNRSAVADLAEMAAAARGTRYARTTRRDAADSLGTLLTNEAEILTLIAGSRTAADDLTSRLRGERPGLAVDVLVASDLGDNVLIGVE